jgi:hypothetical protein
MQGARELGREKESTKEERKEESERGYGKRMHGYALSFSSKMETNRARTCK